MRKRDLGKRSIASGKINPHGENPAIGKRTGIRSGQAELTFSD
jgi:hypothetical protein